MRTFFCVIVAMLFVLTTGCGSRDNDDSSNIKAIPKNAIPTRENFALWQNLWDKKTWIAAYRKNNLNLMNESAVKRSFATALSRFLGTTTSGSSSAIFALANTLEVELLIANTEKYVEDLSGFVAIKFPDNGRPHFASVLPFSTLSAAQVLKSTMELQFKTLERMEGIAWVEPNLQSELYDDYSFPPEIVNATSANTILHRIRAQTAWQYSLKDGVAAYEYGKRNTLTPTTIAVIDTGVDYKHSDLWDDDYSKSGIFINPGEKLNGIDDDGNGYIDDIYGIDASIDKETWNKQAVAAYNNHVVLVPGSADVTGPGVGCPDAPNVAGANACGHGTHVAGLIAAKPGGKTDDELQTIGVCPACKILSIRATQLVNSGGVPINSKIDDISQIRAIRYLLTLVDSGGSPYAKVVNMSLGKYFISRSLAYWFRRLYEKDILVVAAAGNDDSDTPSYPAAYDPVFAVCALDDNMDSKIVMTYKGRGEFAKAYFSNFGSWVDICTPGINLVSTTPGNTIAIKSGTSQASPLVAGAAGFLKSLNPSLSPQALTNQLLNYANAEKLYFNPNNSSDVNKENVLYSGWFPGSTRFFLLGAGILDLGAAATQGKSCDRGVAGCVSFVYTGNYSKLNSQLGDGCVVSSTTQLSFASIFSSMPFILLQFFMLISFWKKSRKKF